MVTITRIFVLSLIFLSKETVLGKKVRIVNGLDAALGEIPYQVSLQHDNHFCGAALLTKDYVITAAHCVNSTIHEKNKELRIVLGSIKVDDPKIIRNATCIYIHEQFGIPRHQANDIAIIKVQPAVQFNEFVSPVILPKKHEVVPAGTKVLASGWGSERGEKEAIVLPDVLQKVEVPVIDHELCSSMYKTVNQTIFPTEICTHEVSTTRKGVCVGDSGGPITLNGVLIGIASWSKKDPLCASPLYPDVHTRVSEYIDWINKNIS